MLHCLTQRRTLRGTGHTMNTTNTANTTNTVTMMSFAKAREVVREFYAEQAEIRQQNAASGAKWGYVEYPAPTAREVLALALIERSGVISLKMGETARALGMRDMFSALAPFVDLLDREDSDQWESLFNGSSHHSDGTRREEACAAAGLYSRRCRCLCR